MRRKRTWYPFCMIMACAVVAFWAILLVRGYALAADGTLVKREKALKALEAVQTALKPNMAPFYSAMEEAGDILRTAALEQQDTAKEEEVPQEEPEDKEREFTQVDMSYLDGALFIGDSRTSTLAEYAGWDQTDFYVEYGLTIWDVMDERIAKDPDTGGTITVREGLQKRKYDKIYIMLGINELGNETADIFYEQYKAVVDEIRALQPEAVVFIQSIMHVSERKDSEGTYINNEEIYRRNDKIQLLADNKHVFWLDVNEVFDQEGTAKLNPDYTGDGVHLKVKCIPIWQDFLLSHGIE